ncbi:hypothetical protein J2S92_000211 [Arthrobacter bambusae]|nr:hypothetical protein [Arthrobacter bambusae]MDQ0234120.1 hypothetical protein [Arthrobacter bambusae]
MLKTIPSGAATATVPEGADWPTIAARTASTAKILRVTETEPSMNPPPRFQTALRCAATPTYWQRRNRVSIGSVGYSARGTLGRSASGRKRIEHPWVERQSPAVPGLDPAPTKDDERRIIVSQHRKLLRQYANVTLDGLLAQIKGQ